MIEPYHLSDEAIERFTSALGVDAVLLSDAERAEFRDPYWPESDHSYESSAVLMPSSTEEIQAVVRIANELKVPLWTSSQGRNNAYGGASPRLAGSVQVSLRRMNKVLEINDKLAYAVVEPGVRWIDLYEAIQESGYDLMMSTTDIGWGSVIGNSLDSGITYLPYGADFMAPTGMEVVLANGELLRTGMGALPGNKTWHLYKRSLGPSLDPLFIQSNFGIVTRMGYWLMRKPEAYAPLLLTVPREEQLDQAIEIMRELRLDGSLRGVPSMYNTLTLAAQMPELLGMFQGGSGPMRDEDIQKIADESGVGRWCLRAALWGAGPVVDHELAHIKQAWSAIEGSKVIHERTYAKDEWDQITSFADKAHAGIPTLDMLDAIPPNIGHIGFSPSVPLVGTDVVEVIDFMRELITTKGGVNFASGILAINERSCLIVCGINFDVTDEEQTRNAYAVTRELVEEAGRRGYGEFRAHIDLMDVTSAQYSFNDHAYRRFVEKIKDAVDPNGIFSPGRHGVWPASYREQM